MGPELEPPLADRDTRPAFRSEGFVVPAGFSLPVDLLDEVRRGAGSQMAQRGDDGRTVEVRDVRRTVPALATLVTMCTPMANQLADRNDMRCMFDEVLVAPPGVPEGTPWHQDDAFGRLRRFSIIRPGPSLTFWIPLQSVSEENGALRYRPRSHRAGIQRHERAVGGRFFIPDCAADDSVTVALDLGQCVVHDGRIIHRANANTTTESRWALGIQFRPGFSSVFRRRTGN